METSSPQGRIKPEKAIALLKEQGIEISTEDAALVVDFLYALALIFYNQHHEL